jgi:hypothetical protein
MAKKYIPVDPYNSDFRRLMQGTAKAIRTGKKELLDAVKKEFAEAEPPINLFYNQETDQIRVVTKDGPPIDFPVSQFEIKA